MKKHLRGTPAHEARKTEMAARRAKYHAQPEQPKPRSTVIFKDSVAERSQMAGLIAAALGATTAIHRRTR